jgi:hypothetical protein
VGLNPQTPLGTPLRGRKSWFGKLQCPCLAMSGYVRKCLAMLGNVWLCSEMSGYVRKCLAMFGNVWLCLEMSGYVRKCLAMLGNVWLRSEMSGYVRKCLAMSGNAWKCPEMPGNILVVGLSLQEIQEVPRAGTCAQHSMPLVGLVFSEPVSNR